jgi:hypothetical protein
MPAITPQEIAGFNPNPSLSLHPADIVVHDAKFNYGKGRENPVDSVVFYRDASDTRGMRVRREKVSHMLPVTFQERILRVYSKDRDEEVVAAVQGAFRRCLRQYK